MRLFSKLPPGLRLSIFWFLISRSLLEIAGIIARLYIAPHWHHSIPWHLSSYTSLAIWGAWDSGWYVPLSKYGYNALPSSAIATFGQANVAFFPLYPLLLFLLSFIGSNFIAGLLVSNISLIAAGYLLYELTRQLTDDQTATRSVKYLYLWPLGFLFSAVLTEGLFLFLSVASFYFIFKKSYVAAFLTGIMLGLTRLVGIAGTVAALGFTKLRRRSRFLLASAPLVGLIIFITYLWFQTGDPLAFIHIQSAWGRHLHAPLREFLNGLLFTNPAAAINSYSLLITSVSLYWWRKSLPLPLLLFSVAALMLPLPSGLASFARYSILAFPLYITLGLSTKSKHIDIALSILCCTAALVFMMSWTCGLPFII